MKLKIETYLSTIVEGKWKTWLSAGSPVVYAESGYASLEEMRRELRRRFPHEQPQDIPNGLRMRLYRSDHDYQLVTLIP